MREFHGFSRTKLYHVYHAMKQRCYNSKDQKFNLYGGRGVIICENWLENPKSFFKWAMDNGYEEGLTIDRENHYGNYEPSNCSWVTFKKQNSHLAHRKDNKSGYRGVRITSYGTFQVYVKNKCLGSYKTAIEGAKLRNEYIADNCLDIQLNKI